MLSMTYYENETEKGNEKEYYRFIHSKSKDRKHKT